MVEGMPQAVSLLSRILNQNQHDKKKKKLTLDHVFLWYDCLCLPQNIHPFRRTEEERLEFQVALQNLDQLAQKCQMLCLHSEDYSKRAWCAFEYFQRATVEYDGHLTIDCQKVLDKVTVDWGFQDSEIKAEKESEQETERASANVSANQAFEESAQALERMITETDGQLQQQLRAVASWQQNHNTNRQQVNQTVERVLANAQRSRFRSNQEQWKAFRENIAAQDDEQGSKKKVPPDLERQRIRISNGSFTTLPPQPPFVNAMTVLIRELFTATFHLSCRDAAAITETKVAPNTNACVPGVGVQCGLHDFSNAKPLEDQEKALIECWSESSFKRIASLGELVCPQGHRLQPNGAYGGSLNCDIPSCGKTIPPGSMHAGCSGCNYDICFACATGSKEDEPATSSSGSTTDQWQLLVQACQQTKPASRGEKQDGQIICERRVTVDLFELAFKAFDRFGLRCTNDGDVAFVGLLALANILTREVEKPQPEKDQVKDDAHLEGGDQASNTRKATVPKNHKQPTDITATTVLLDVFKSTIEGSKKQHDGKEDSSDDTLQLSPGALCHLGPLLRQAILVYATSLANGTEITSLVASISLRVPRWVLLDMAQGKLNTTTALTIDESLCLGMTVQRYLWDNPQCLSFSLDTNEAPLKHVFCDIDPSCAGGWAPCKHEQKHCMMVNALANQERPGTLDPWSKSSLPVPLGQFVTLRNNGDLYIIGGATGEEEPDTCVYTACTESVYKTTVPICNETSWTKVGELSVPRRAHMGCVRNCDGDTVQFLIGGGRAATTPGEESEMLTSVESWTVLACSEEQESDLPAAQWSTILELPRPRVNGHMTFHEGCLFVVGGRSEASLLAPDPGSQICDIYSFSTTKWSEGPVHPIFFTGGDMILFQDRFAWVMGGKGRGNFEFLQSSFALDLQPWSEWANSGSPEDKKPSSGWIEGPPLPSKMASPNLCVARQEDTGLAVDWLLSVGSFPNGCYCLGMPLPSVDSWEGADQIQWSQRGLNVFWPARRRRQNSAMRWSLMGDTPDAVSVGRSVVAKGVLSLLGGNSMTIVHGMTTTDTIHFRPLPIPSFGLNTNTVRSGTNMFGMMSMLSNRSSSTSQKVALNNRYLMSRLGFPYKASDLYATNGEKKLVLKEPNDFPCQRCLIMTNSMEVAKSHNDVALYAVIPGPRVKTHTTFGRGGSNTTVTPLHRELLLCSECICDLYFN